MDEKIRKLVDEAEKRTMFATASGDVLLRQYADVCRDVLALCAAIRVMEESRTKERVAWLEYANARATAEYYASNGDSNQARAYYDRLAKARKKLGEFGILTLNERSI